MSDQEIDWTGQGIACTTCLLGFVAASDALSFAPTSTAGGEPLSGGGVGPGPGSRCRPGAVPRFAFGALAGLRAPRRLLLTLVFLEPHSTHWLVVCAGSTRTASLPRLGAWYSTMARYSPGAASRSGVRTIPVHTARRRARTPVPDGAPIARWRPGTVVGLFVPGPRSPAAHARSSIPCLCTALPMPYTGPMDIQPSNTVGAGVSAPSCAGSRMVGADVLISAGFSDLRRMACLGEPRSRSRQAPFSPPTRSVPLSPVPDTL